MAEDSAWEWVDGDPVRSAQFALGMGIFITTGLALVAFFALAALNLVSFPLWPVNALLLVLLAIELPFAAVYPRRHPIISRLGLSAVGLRLSMPTYTFTVPWRAVRQIGPDFVVLDFSLGWGRYKLSPAQARRLIEFVQPATVPQLDPRLPVGAAI